MILRAGEHDFRELNAKIRESSEDCEIVDCIGQRYIGAALAGKNITVHGTPGNALGTYLDGGNITVIGNAQDAVGDTMNDGIIAVHGCVGDAAGYAMRGGAVFIKENAGYRAGIHMKAYGEKQPVLVIGGRAGSFLGEYQAGGTIVVLGLHRDGKKIVGNFPCTGMHGGRMFLRGKCEDIRFPKNVTACRAEREDLDALMPMIDMYGDIFGIDVEVLKNDEYTVVKPDTENPYKELYVNI